MRTSTFLPDHRSKCPASELERRRRRAGKGFSTLTCRQAGGFCNKLRVCARSESAASTVDNSCRRLGETPLLKPGDSWWGLQASLCCCCERSTHSGAWQSLHCSLWFLVAFLLLFFIPFVNYYFCGSFSG